MDDESNEDKKHSPIVGECNMEMRPPPQLTTFMSYAYLRSVPRVCEAEAHLGDYSRGAPA